MIELKSDPAAVDETKVAPFLGGDITETIVNKDVDDTSGDTTKTVVNKGTEGKGKGMRQMTRLALVVFALSMALALRPCLGRLKSNQTRLEYLQRRQL